MIDTLLRDADPARTLDADPSSPPARALLADILAHPREPRRRPSRPVRRVVIGGALAGAAATVALAAPMPWDGHGPGLGSAAYAVARGSDGSVHIAVRWSELDDPAGLQAALDRAGARTKIIVHNDGDPACVLTANTVGYSARAVQWQSPGTATGGLVVRPADFPAGGTLVIGVDLAPAGSTGLSTFAPGRPQLEGFSGFMVIGTVPTCVP